MTFPPQPPGHPPYPAYPPPPPTNRPNPVGFAVTALALGIVGTLLAWMPIVNNFTAVGAVVGLALGFIGLWKSRIVMSAIGTFLCGFAVILTVLAQLDLGEALDRPDDATRAATTPSVETTTVSKPAAEPAKYTPTAEDWELDVMVTEQQCFGSAGCMVTLHVELRYLGRFAADDTVSYRLVYDVLGTKSTLRGSTEVTGTQYSQEDHFVSTASSNVKLKARVVSFTEVR